MIARKLLCKTFVPSSRLSIEKNYIDRLLGHIVPSWSRIIRTNRVSICAKKLNYDRNAEAVGVICCSSVPPTSGTGRNLRGRENSASPPLAFHLCELALLSTYPPPPPSIHTHKYTYVHVYIHRYRCIHRRSRTGSELGWLSRFLPLIVFRKEILSDWISGPV